MVLLAGSLQRNVSVELQTIPGTAMMAGEGYVWRSVCVCVCIQLLVRRELLEDRVSLLPYIYGV